MPIVADSTPAYCSIADVRAFHVADSVSDDTIDTAIGIATEVINTYTGAAFGLPEMATYTVNDVRKPLVALPTPFSNITTVSANGVNLDTSQWTQESWGIRLYTFAYYDADGFPYADYSFTDLLALDSWPYGVQVSVTAAFGYTTVPASVARAAITLAARFATQSESDMPPDSRVKRLGVEGYDIVWDDTNSNIDTTGDLAVDRLLRGYRSMDAWVG